MNLTRKRITTMPWNYVHGTNNSETINAADGVTEAHDHILGHGGDDTIFGLGGSDVLEGNAGADHLDGGANLDWASYVNSPSGVIVDLASGTGKNGDAEGDTLVNVECVIGSWFEDILIGDGGDNGLRGGGSDDVLKGGGGDDNLFGEGGNDTLTGGAGADSLLGGAGIDTAAYIDSAQGVAISLIDNLASRGDAAGDSFSSIENLTGSGHRDILRGDNGANVLSGLDGNDTLEGLGGADTLIGGQGHDTLDGGANNDTMIGGLGNDTYYVDSWWDVVTEFGGQGTDTVFTTVSWTLTAGADVETLRTTNDNGTAAIHLTGNASGNNIVGNDGYNVINGGGGADQMTGRGGNDTYFVDHVNDAVIESAGQGVDTVRTSVSWVLTGGADVETLTTTNHDGVAAINLTGNSSGNVVIGNNGSNVINGGDGNDELTGRGGQDSFLFNTALNAATNVDVITDFNVTDDTILLDQDIFSSSLGLGYISAGEFVIGAAAQDANDRIIYDSSTGALYYDSDGVGGTAAVQFAQMNTGLGLTHLDFLVV
jgi:Ca2+-binding RTX toxin-like protein